jgi:hypothetical protein
MINARLWAWINGGWVKLTLKPQQSLSWGRARRTDEGHNTDWESFAFDGQYVIHNYGSYGRDCDGGYEHSETRRAFVTKLQTNNRSRLICCTCRNSVREYDGEVLECWDRNHKGIMLEINPSIPSWEHLDGRQRDQYAELMGY